jgi:hypothetical protein
MFGLERCGGVTGPKRIGISRILGSNSGEGLIIDGTAVDALVYCREYVSEDAYKNLCKTLEFQEALWRCGGAKIDGNNGARVLFILALPVAEWLIDDGVRNMDEPEAVLEEFRYVLNEWEIPFVELGRDLMELGRRIEWMVPKARLDASMSIEGASHRRWSGRVAEWMKGIRNSSPWVRWVLRMKRISSSIVVHSEDDCDLYSKCVRRL